MPNTGNRETECRADVTVAPPAGEELLVLLLSHDRGCYTYTKTFEDMGLWEQDF